MTVVDVGTHIGYFTLLACHLVGRHGRVYAFEPEAHNFELLQRNVELNGFRNAVLVRKAVSERSGLGTLILSTKSTHHSLYGSGAQIDVDVVSLDDYFTAEQQYLVDLVKIDAEGAELSVLLGMQDLMRRNPDLRLILELSAINLKRAGVDLRQVVTLLQSEGYDLYVIEDNGLQPFLPSHLDELSAHTGYTNVFATRRP